jgi:hypothetical protein
MLSLILKLNPLDVTPELAAVRDSLIVERLNESSEQIRLLLEETK